MFVHMLDGKKIENIEKNLKISKKSDIFECFTIFSIPASVSIPATTATAMPVPN